MMNVLSNKDHFAKTLLILVIVMFLAGCVAPKPNITVPMTPPPVMPLKNKPQVVLVLGGGGARGYAHIGVIKVLQNAGVPIDMIVGASAGSLMGAMYADNGDATQLENTMLNTTLGDFIDVAVVPDLKGPVIGNQFQDFLLNNMHAKDFNQLKTKLVVVTTDLDTGKPYPIESGPIAPAVLASAAIPGIVRPHTLYGHTLVDGGVVDPVPVDIAKTYHPKIIIAVDLVSDLPPQMPNTSYGIFYRAYSISWDKLDELSAKDADVIIHPNVGSASMFDIRQKNVMFEEGEAAAYQALPKIRRLLALHHIKLQPKVISTQSNH